MEAMLKLAVCLVALIFWTVVVPLIGRYVSKAKNRSGAERFWLAFPLGLLGDLVAAVLPAKEPPAPLVQATPRMRYPKGHPMNYKNQKPENDDDWPDVVTGNDCKTE